MKTSKESKPQLPENGPVLGPVLEVRRLTKRYDTGRVAVDALSFAVSAGEIFGLLGPNGAGKSTTISMLTSTTTPTSGDALLAGVSINDSRKVRQRIGVAFQDSVLDTEFTGRENLLLHARLWSLPRDEAKQRIESLLQFMGLADRADENVRNYSGGMKRRLEIARALLARPHLVVLDEPTVGLDPAVRDEIWALIKQMRDTENISILLSTHYLEEAQAVCDRVAILSEGKLVAIGAPNTLIMDMGKETVDIEVRGDLSTLEPHLLSVLSQSRDAPIKVMVRRGLISMLVRDNGQFALDTTVALVQAAGFTVSQTTLRQTTLADIFAHLTFEGPKRSDPEDPHDPNNPNNTDDPNSTVTTLRPGNTSSKKEVAA
jgi:ABC-2 type transport system ATP-binding protein